MNDDTLDTRLESAGFSIGEIEVIKVVCGNWKAEKYRNAKLSALLVEAKLELLKPLQVEAQYASDRSERKELHSNVEGTLELINEAIKELEKQRESTT